MKALILFLLLCVITCDLDAQTPRRAARYPAGFLPYTGVHYYKKGIDYASIKLMHNDRIWVDNKLPQGQMIKLEINDLSGFKANFEGHIFPLMRVKLVHLKTGEVLSEDERKTEKDNPMVEHTMFSIGYGLIAKEDMPVGSYRWIITIEDEASDHYLELKADIEVVAAEEPLLTAEYSQDIGFVDLMDIYYTGVSMDWTTSAVRDQNPKSRGRYQRTLILPNVRHLTEEEFLKGKVLLGVYDHLGRRVQDADAHLKKRKITIDTQPGPDLTVDIKAFIEFENDTKEPLHYSIRFYWVSRDGQKAFDVFLQ